MAWWNGTTLLGLLVFLFFGVESEPQGHLKPLGNHRPPEKLGTLVDELFDIPDPQTFWERYVSPSRAVVFRGAAKNSPAFQRWTDDYLRERYGDLEVRLEGKLEKNSRIPVGSRGLGRDTLESFLNTYHDQDSYVISQLPTAMYEEVSVLPCMSCGNMWSRIAEVNLWMSSGNSKSILHKDAYNAINCLYRGTKWWKLFEYKYEKWIHKAWEPSREVGGYSEVDVNSVDLIKHPNISRIPWSNLTVEAGDCLFLPKSYYHQVSSFGENLAVSILFSRLSSFDDTGCTPEMIGHRPLSHAHPMWNWGGRGGEMSMGNMDLENLRKNFQREALINNDQFTAQRLLGILEESMPEHDRESLRHTAEKAWDALSDGSRDYLTVEDLERADWDRLRRFVSLLAPPEPSNNEWFEYDYIPTDEILGLLEYLCAEQTAVDRELFLTQYTRHLGGSAKVGREIFDKLAKDTDSNHFNCSDVQENVEYALEEWHKLGKTPQLTEEEEKRKPISHHFNDEL